MRILYVPNELGDFRQSGFRRPLANLKSAGLIEDVSVYSLLWRVKVNPTTAIEGLIERTREFRPDVVLMQHVGFTGLRDEHLRAMRASSDFKLIYHEGDPYSRWLHPLRSPARAAARVADVVFTVGAGTFSNNFRRSGARDVRWIPSAFDPERYPRRTVLTESVRESDVVIVANRNRPRFRGHPNWRDRIRFVELMQARFGSRLALYGHGWSGAGARGPIGFAEQQDAVRSAWVSANWDHYAAEPKYFSNRVPISLAAGTIHAWTEHPGYDEIFPKGSSGFAIRSLSPEGLVDNVDAYLATSSVAERIEASREAQNFSYAHFRQDDLLVQMLNFERERIKPDAASDSWDLRSAGVTEM